MAADDVDVLHFGAREGGADLDLDALGGRFTDQHVVLTTHVGNDRFVELVAADAHGFRIDDAVERDHRDFRGATADVDDHRAARLADRDAGAERGGDRFFDHPDLARTGVFDRLADRAAFDLGRAVWHADHDARHRTGHAAFLHLADEVLQHLLGDGVVGNDAVTQRAHRADVGRCATEHLLGFDADRLDLLGATRIHADRDHRRFIQDDAFVANVDEGIGRAQIDGQVIDKQTAYGVEHRGGPEV